MADVSSLTINGDSRYIADASARKRLDELEELTGKVTVSDAYKESYSTVKARFEKTENLVSSLNGQTSDALSSTVKDKKFSDVDSRFEEIESEIVSARGNSYDSMTSRLDTIETNISSISDKVTPYYSSSLFSCTGSINDLTWSKDSEKTIATTTPILTVEEVSSKNYVDSLDLSVAAILIDNSNNILDADISYENKGVEDNNLKIGFTIITESSSYTDAILSYAIWQGSESLELLQARISSFDLEEKDTLQQRLNTDFDYAANAIKVGKNNDLIIQPGSSGGIKDQTIWEWMKDNYNTEDNNDIINAIESWLTNNYDTIDNKDVVSAIEDWLTNNYDTIDNKDVVSAIEDWLTNNYDTANSNDIVKVIKGWLTTNYNIGDTSVVKAIGDWLTKNYDTTTDKDVVAAIKNWLTTYQITVEIETEDENGNLETITKTQTLGEYIQDNYGTISVGAALTKNIEDWLTDNYFNDKNEDGKSDGDDVSTAIWTWLTANYLNDEDENGKSDGNDISTAIWTWLTTNYNTGNTPIATIVKAWLNSKYNITDSTDDIVGVIETWLTNNYNQNSNIKSTITDWLSSDTVTTTITNEVDTEVNKQLDTIVSKKVSAIKTATTTSNGLMSSGDKTALDSLATVTNIPVYWAKNATLSSIPRDPIYFVANSSGLQETDNTDTPIKIVKTGNLLKISIYFHPSVVVDEAFLGTIHGINPAIDSIIDFGVEDSGHNKLSAYKVVWSTNRDNDNNFDMKVSLEDYNIGYGFIYNTVIPLEG